MDESRPCPLTITIPITRNAINALLALEEVVFDGPILIRLVPILPPTKCEPAIDDGGE